MTSTVRSKVGMDDERSVNRPVSVGGVNNPRDLVSDPAVSARSFEDFFEVEHDRLLGALYLITGNRHDAEELMQDAFLKVWERWDLVETTNPTGYLYRTAINFFRMRRRRLLVAARHVLPWVPPRDAFEEVEIREDLRRYLESLSARQRAALVLTELLGYPNQEAARTLGITASTVRALTTQARAALRSSIGERHE
jgi:RNA polymerase sigma factor (sigma-70 family)